MRSRVSELHYEYCVKKPEIYFKLIDSRIEEYCVNEEEQNSIDWYVCVVV